MIAKVETRESLPRKKTKKLKEKGLEKKEK